MKSLNLLRALLQDASLSCGASTERDWVTIQSRTKTEGISFLTITLPRFTSWLEQSLEAGRVLPTIYSTFRKKRKNKSTLPCFLQGLVKLVFDEKSGLLLTNADPSAVFYIRQIGNTFKKVKMECTSARQRHCIESFVETDSSLPAEVSLTKLDQSVAYLVVESLYFPDSHEQCLPKHGPGAVVERLTGNQKYKIRDFYSRWRGIFDPVDLYGSSVLRTKDITLVSEDEEKPCQLRLVPKTLKTPRTIAKEPTAMQYAQQYVGSRLILSMAHSEYTKHIKFTDQTVNRKLALEGASTGSVATIDLSEASDRISLALVESLFRDDPILLSSLMAARSRRISLPNGELLTLKKFSTSGSAITFPVETLVFFIIALSAVISVKGISGSSLVQAAHRWARAVSVYGDDIVVPSDCCSSVVARLEALGLKVNVGKTFKQGPFRESCGGDYFKSYDVTPKYLRRPLDGSRIGLESLSSLAATSNQLFFAGCWHAANYLREFVDSRQRLPLVKRTSPGVGWHTHKDVYTFTRILKDFSIRVRTLVVRNKARPNPLDGYYALLKHHLSSDVQEDPLHLSQSAVKYNSRVGLKWTTPY
jgi:hypothetical protein